MIVPNVIQAEILVEKNRAKAVRLHSEKFKTVRTDLYFTRPLSAEEAPANAIVPSLLRRGCINFPSALEVERKLEALYGATLDFEVSKKGDNQIIHIGISHVADKFASGGARLFYESAEFLARLVKYPILVNGNFREDEFLQERSHLVDLIRSRINDKISYANLRCIETMFYGEAFSVHSEGSEAEAADLRVVDATSAWQNLLKNSDVWACLSGEVSDDDAKQWLSCLDFILERSEEGKNGLVKNKVNRAADMLAAEAYNQDELPIVKRVEEFLDVNQGKLCMGLRFNNVKSKELWPAMLVYNGILGGDLHSKLFQNVREKSGLAYYASSRMERLKNVMFINSGIEAENREKTEAIILEQLEDMRKGKITDDEHTFTLRSLNTGLKTMQDNQMGIVDFFMSQHLTGAGDTFESLADMLSKVKIDDVVGIAQKVTLDTSYFLRPPVK